MQYPGFSTSCQSGRTVLRDGFGAGHQISVLGHIPRKPFIKRNPPERVEPLKRFLLLFTPYQVISSLVPWRGDWPPPHGFPESFYWRITSHPCCYTRISRSESGIVACSALAESVGDYLQPYLGKSANRSAATAFFDFDAAIKSTRACSQFFRKSPLR